MVWGFISYYNAGQLVHIDSNLNSTKYCKTMGRLDEDAAGSLTASNYATTLLTERGSYERARG